MLRTVPTAARTAVAPSVTHAGTTTISSESLAPGSTGAGASPNSTTPTANADSPLPRRRTVSPAANVDGSAETSDGATVAYARSVTDRERASVGYATTSVVSGAPPTRRSVRATPSGPVTAIESRRTEPPAAPRRIPNTTRAPFTGTPPAPSSLTPSDCGSVLPAGTRCRFPAATDKDQSATSGATSPSL